MPLRMHCLFVPFISLDNNADRPHPDKWMNHLETLRSWGVDRLHFLISPCVRSYCKVADPKFCVQRHAYLSHCVFHFAYFIAVIWLLSILFLSVCLLLFSSYKTTSLCLNIYCIATPMLLPCWSLLMLVIFLILADRSELALSIPSDFTIRLLGLISTE